MDSSLVYEVSYNKAKQIIDNVLSGERDRNNFRLIFLG